MPGVPQLSGLPPANANPSVTPGSGQEALNGGYTNALGSLNKSLKLLQGSDSSQMMQAQQGLAQNQGKVQQGLINSGLGNTTVAQTMQQAPQQTYNNQIQGIQNNLANQQVGVLGQGAKMQQDAGNQAQQYQQFLQQLQLSQQTQADKVKSTAVTYPNGFPMQA